MTTILLCAMLAAAQDKPAASTHDANAAKPLAPGGYALLPAEMRHFAWTKDGATVQVHGMGPFVLNYVNPADDPSKATPGR
ncbi:MAG TPA: hypothetical protein VGX68_08370 [Thermoanaerobaculia bacterium]|jgi:hypothetical protein|nr:hypothetical protein [Thermoanaerobaculia bacterium]